MNMLRKLSSLRVISSRLIETGSSFNQSVVQTKNHKPGGNQLIVEPLTDRELVRVRGKEVVSFLQGLITNDMGHLDGGRSLMSGYASMYAMFLNKTGRVLYDVIIYRTSEPDTFLIECDRSISSELRRHLRLYRVRRKVDIDSMEEFRPWTAYSADGVSPVRFDTTRLSAEVFYTPDPRVRDLGLRILASSDKRWGDVAKIFVRPGEVAVSPSSSSYNYQTHRYRYGVGEGVHDLPPGKCFPLEANGDFLHGVSFQKGCYIGQELTARVFHTGFVRKRLMPLLLTAPLPEKVNTVKSLAGSTVGTIRGVNYNRALALLRVEQVLSAPDLEIDGDPCYTEKPKWWPAELPNRETLREIGY